MHPKPLPNHHLSKMPKGRISDIMQQPGTLQNIADIALILRQKSRVLYLLQDSLGYILPQGFAEGRYLQGVGEPGTDKIALIQRKNLGLILQPPKGSAADDPMIILLVFSSQVSRPAPPKHRANPFIAKQPAPLHGKTPLYNKTSPHPLQSRTCSTPLAPWPGGPYLPPRYHRFLPDLHSTPAAARARWYGNVS